MWEVVQTAGVTMGRMRNSPPSVSFQCEAKIVVQDYNPSFGTT